MLLGTSNNWDMAIKVFTEGRKNYLEKKTMDGYLVLLKTFTDWLKKIGFDTEIPPPQMVEGVIEDYLDYCLNAKNSSKGTANSKLTALKVFFDYLVQNNVITYNPAANIKKFKADGKHIYSALPNSLEEFLVLFPLIHGRVRGITVFLEW
jgi:site-specific recombinase XerD